MKAHRLLYLVRRNPESARRELLDTYRSAGSVEAARSLGVSHQTMLKYVRLLSLREEWREVGGILELSRHYEHLVRKADVRQYDGTQRVHYRTHGVRNESWRVDLGQSKHPRLIRNGDSRRHGRISVEVSGVRMSETVLALLDQLAREWRVPRDDVLLAMLDIASKKGLNEITRADVRAHIEQLRPSSTATTPGDLWLDPIPISLRARAREVLEAGNAIGFLSLSSSVYGLDLVWFNRDSLLARGCHEKALSLSAKSTCSRSLTRRESTRTSFSSCFRGRYVTGRF